MTRSEQAATLSAAAEVLRELAEGDYEVTRWYGKVADLLDATALLLRLEDI